MKLNWMPLNVSTRLRSDSSFQEYYMLNRKTYFIREHVDFMKLSGVYDILDPETQGQIGIAREEISNLIKMLRLLIGKQLLPTTLSVYEGTDYTEKSKILFSIHRPFSFLRSKVKILDAKGTQLGLLKSKLFSIGGAFTVLDNSENEIASVKGDWKGWNFQVSDTNGNKIGVITKKWAGIGKELFTSADNYLISLEKDSSEHESILLLAAGLAVDIIYKEN